MPSIRPNGFKNEPICEKSLEDALQMGKSKSDQLKPTDFKETSIRFCIDGLFKWYKSYAKHYGKSSVFIMFRDLSWYWASYCESNEVVRSLSREYDSLLRNITEHTSYTDLAERMDEATRVKEIGKRGYPFSILVPSETHGVISDCATALGISFSMFYQIGLGKALSANRDGLYSDWVKGCFSPLFAEVIGRAETRLLDLQEIGNTMDYRIRLELKKHVSATLP